jgi:hypothetical protein
MDLAEDHIRNAGYGGFSFRDLAAEIGIKSASTSPPRQPWQRLSLVAMATGSLRRWHAG